MTVSILQNKAKKSFDFNAASQDAREEHARNDASDPSVLSVDRVGLILCGFALQSFQYWLLFTKHMQLCGDGRPTPD